MSRWVSVVVIAVLGIVLFNLPHGDRGRLAALQVHELLLDRGVAEPSEPVVGVEPPPGPETAPRRGAADEPQRLVDRILAGRHVREDENGDLELTLGGVRMETGELQLTLALAARRSILLGLRKAASELDPPRTLRVVGERAPQRGGAAFLVVLDGSQLSLRYEEYELDPLTNRVTPRDQVTVRRDDWMPASRLSVLPPLVAIALAILLRKPLPALFFGVFAGAALLRSQAGDSGAAALGLGLKDVFTEYFWIKLKDPYHMQIIGFVVVTMAMIGVMTRSGGIRGLVDSVAGFARGVRSTLVSTWLMGLVVFFDDYANCILVGTTMRPLTDKFRIAREKLAYLVDSTAAPVAGISVFSTWIAYEVSTFAPQLPAAGLSVADGYDVFLQTIPYRFYCLFTLMFGFLVAVSGRDFGPMHAAETRARATGQLVRKGSSPMVGADATEMEPAPGVTPRARAALVPLAAFVLGSLVLIVQGGGGFDLPASELFSLRGMTAVLGAGSGPLPLLYGAILGLVAAVLFALAAGLRGEILAAAWRTLRSMGVAIAILYLAWMIGLVCERLFTSSYLTAQIGDGLVPELLPILLFLLAALTAFATGTSWGTMSILLPLVVGLAYNLGADAHEAGMTLLTGHGLLILSIGAVLEGAIFGDHCSPISDTTVLSSTASASDHIDHVRTQAPYAMLAMAVAVCAGYLPCAFYRMSPLLSLGLGAAVLLLVILVFGKRPGAAPRTVPAE